jgi:hypothetical protein
MVLKRFFLLCLPFAFVTSLCASTLNIYQDQSIYKYKSDSKYIGFSSDIKVECNDKQVITFLSDICPKEERLCKISQSIKELSNQSQEISNTLQAVDSITNNIILDVFNSKNILEQSKLIAKEKTELILERNGIDREIERQNTLFTHQASSLESLNLEEECQGVLSLRIPASRLSFANVYEANLVNEDTIEVKQSLKLSNTSGIDIKADKVKLYYRDSQEYVAQRQFSPWIIRKKEEIRASLKKVNSPAPMMMSEGGDIASVESTVEIYRTDEREYMIENLDLPASPNDKTYEMASQKLSAECGISIYGYMQEGAFNVCSIEPKVQIETNRMIVKKGDEILNASARGEYRDGKYKIYISKDRDIKINRKSILTKDNESGIFGGNIKKKDGYELTLLNASSKIKKIKLIERIPVSTSDDIKVKLLSIEGVLEDKYVIDEDGKIDFNLTLKPNEKVAIKVLFELTYDKDISVTY